MEAERNNNDFFLTFPEEVWIIILDKLDTSTKVSLLNSNLYPLRRLLLPSRPTILFPDVWDVVCKRIPETFDSSANYIPLREVCKSWQLGVDNALLERNAVYRINQPMFEENFPEGFWNNMEFSNASKVLRFQEHFNSIKSTQDADFDPFKIGRQVHFTFPDKRQENILLAYQAALQFDTAVKDLLQKYGHQVNFCKISIYDDLCPRERVKFFVRVTKWISLMPNLMSLDWAFPPGPEQLSPSDYKMYFDALSPSPYLHFHNLRIARFINLPTCIVDELLKRNNHIVSLTSAPNHPSFDRVTIPDLQRLSICFNRYDKFMQFAKRDQPWELSIVCFNFSYKYEFSWELLYSVLLKWLGTLRVIKLIFPVTSEAEEEEYDLQVDRLREKIRSLPMQKGVKIELDLSVEL